MWIQNFIIEWLCCSSYNHPPKFWPAPKFRDSLESFTWSLHTLGFTLWARVSLHTHLACSFHPNFCMLMSMSCLRPCFGQGLRLMCTCYVRYEIICHSHAQSPIHYCVSVIMVDQRLITSLALIAYTISQSCWTCVSGWFESSLCQVMGMCVVISHLHLSLVHTLCHVAEVIITKHNPTIKSIDCHPEQCKSTNKVFKLRCPQEIPSTFMLATQRFCCRVNHPHIPTVCIYQNNASTTIPGHWTLQWNQIITPYMVMALYRFLSYRNFNHLAWTFLPRLY